MGKALEKRINWGRLRQRYHCSTRKNRSKLLDELSDLYRMHRKSVIRKLNQSYCRKKRRRGPKPKYTAQAYLPVLRRIWFSCDQMCSKKLKQALPLWLPFYEHHYGNLTQDLRIGLLEMSAATIDRLLAPIKAGYPRKRICGTKPGSLLKQQIPIKTNQWEETKPGFVEADTVAHCGNSLQGNFAWSLTLTDIHTTWTENRACWNKGAAGVIKNIADIEASLPFPLRGFDCDNGSEFLNYHLIRYFHARPKEKMVQFTRSRPYKKNDNAHVEQKNWTHVRQLFGYDRIDKPSVIKRMNDLYRNEWSQLQNHFIPVMKCIKKTKINSKYRKQYDTPKTPYERVLACDSIPDEKKAALKKLHQTLDPFVLKQQIEQKLKQIFKTIDVTKKVRRRL